MRPFPQLKKARAQIFSWRDGRILDRNGSIIPLTETIETSGRRRQFCTATVQIRKTHCPDRKMGQQWGFLSGKEDGRDLQPARLGTQLAKVHNDISA